VFLCFRVYVFLCLFGRFCVLKYFVCGFWCFFVCFLFIFCVSFVFLLICLCFCVFLNECRGFLCFCILFQMFFVLCVFLCFLFMVCGFVGRFLWIFCSIFCAGNQPRQDHKSKVPGRRWQTKVMKSSVFE